MIQKLKIYSTIIIVLLSFSCTKDRKSEAIDPSRRLKTVEIEKPNYIKDKLVEFTVDPKPGSNLDFNQYFKVESLIFLKDQELIGDVKKLIQFDDKFFIHDKIREKIHCYNLNGNHIWSTTNQGEGPNEYIKLQGFDVNLKDSVVSLWDSRGLQVLNYNMETGNVINKNKLESFGHDFMVFNEKYIIYPLGYYHKDLSYKLLFVNNNNQLVKKYLPFESQDEINERLPMKVFSKNANDENFYFTHSYNDTVYYFSQDTLYAKYKVNYGSKRKIDFSNFKTDQEIYQHYKNNKLFDKSMDGIIDLGSNLLFNYSLYNETYDAFTIKYGLLNKEKNEIQLFNRFDENPFDWNKSLYPDILFVKNNYAFISIDPSHYNNMRKAWDEIEDGIPVSEHCKEKFPFIYDIITSTSDSSNPVIVKLKIL